jgi:hypothetical protein
MHAVLVIPAQAESSTPQRLWCLLDPRLRGDDIIIVGGVMPYAEIML